MLEIISEAQELVEAMGERSHRTVGLDPATMRMEIRLQPV
jgi:hypothetical protein